MFCTVGVVNLFKNLFQLLKITLNNVVKVQVIRFLSSPGLFKDMTPEFSDGHGWYDKNF